MKTLSILAAPAAVTAQWWGGAPDCAQSCLSSAFSANSANWPDPTSYCLPSGPAATVSSCLSTACTATPTAHSSYSSLSSSLCSHYSSCSAAGSTGVYTASAPAFTGANGWGAGVGGPFNADATWTGGLYTVTGCEWNGSPWAGGPAGWGQGGMGGGSGFGPWAPWGKGWKYIATSTATLVQTLTPTGDNAQPTITTGLATVAVAVSGTLTTTQVLKETAGANAAVPAGVDAGVKLVGAMLGGVVAIAGLL